MADILTPVSADALFSTANDQQAQMETLANQSLSNGIDKYSNGDYKGAALDFKRAFGLSPYGTYATTATKYLALSYQKTGDPDKAIQAYQDALKIHTDDDELQTALGNLFFGEGRTGEAIAAYEAAVRIYDDANNRFSLGQGYLKAGRNDDAQKQFEKVIQMDSQGPNGYFGLGQALSAQKKYTAAIEQFERAYQKDEKFYDALGEMGFTYADAGMLDEAKQVQSDLEHKDDSLAETLSSYINKKTDPKIMFAWTTGSFRFYLPPKTQVAALSDYMANAGAGASQSFTMAIQFNKEMDRESVENVLNWSISRSAGNGPSMDYNYGLGIPDTEVALSPYPTDVLYDEKYFSATVRFTINQNAAGDGTIDPSHIVFSFKGQDKDGNSMDADYDQYMGFSGHF